MSFVELDRVDFSRDDRLEDTPMRLRASARCRSPVPASEHSVDGTPRPSERSAASVGARVQPTPAQQPSIPRHRPIAGRTELLRSLDESVSELRDELHNRSAESRVSQRSERARIDDLCRKLDVIATVVLRHERELKEHASFVEPASQRSRPAYPPFQQDSSSATLMRSILEKVNQVNELMESAVRPSPARTRASFSGTIPEEAGYSASSAAEVAAGPLTRVAEALETVAEEVRRQHHAIDRLSDAQARRDEEERIASMMELHPPSDVAASDCEQTVGDDGSAARFRRRMESAGAEFDAARGRATGRTPSPSGETAGFEEGSGRISVNEESPRRARFSQNSSRISADEASPRRARYAAPPAENSRVSSGRISVDEGSPRRARYADPSIDSQRIAVDEASPRRSRSQMVSAAYFGPAVDPEYYESSADEHFEATPREDADESPRRVRGSTTVAAKTSFNMDNSLARTVTKQPEYIVRSATKGTASKSRKPLMRDLFDDASSTSSKSSARTPSDRASTQRSALYSSRMTVGAQDELIRRLMHENESLKEQLHEQLVKNDDMRSAVKEYHSSPVGRSRLGGSMMLA